MINLFAILDLNESSSGAANVLEKKCTFIEFYLRVIKRNTLIKDQNLIGAMSSYLGSLFLDREEGSLRAVGLLDDKFIFFPLVSLLLFLLNNGAAFLFESFLFLLLEGDNRIRSQYCYVFIDRLLESSLDLSTLKQLLVNPGFLSRFPEFLKACSFLIVHKG